LLNNASQNTAYYDKGTSTYTTLSESEVYPGNKIYIHKLPNGNDGKLVKLTVTAAGNDVRGVDYSFSIQNDAGKTIYSKENLTHNTSGFKDIYEYTDFSSVTSYISCACVMAIGYNTISNPPIHFVASYLTN
jgi:hypothetical protein